jgi:hypothetical protein
MQTGRLATLTLRVRGNDGKPVTGAVVTVSATMQVHDDHGAPDTATADEQEPGTYVRGLVPSMPGPWELIVTVDSPDGQFVTVFHVQVE